MLGITEKYNKFKESTYFAGGKFVIYATCVCLAATFAVGYLGLIIGFPLLTFPLAMLISNPVVWVLMGVVLTAAYKMVVEPLFYLAKNYISKKRAPEGEKSPGKPKLQRSKSLDSGLDIISRKTDDSDDKRRRNSYSPSIDSGVSVGSIESEQPKQTKIVRYNTTGDGNCFFHAVFGNNSSGTYRAEKAQEMRLEWHRFLSQFEHLNDESMPAPLRGQLHKVFSMFLDGTEERIEQVKKIIELAKQKNAKVETAYNNAKKEEAETSVENLFINMPELYQAYLETIKSQSYYVFIEEILILASLANIEITVHYQHNGTNGHEVFKPDPQMINDDGLNQVFNRESYKLNDELWGNKKRETIHLKSGHYERAEIVEVEPFLMEKASSAVQNTAAACVNALGLSTQNVCPSK